MSATVNIGSKIPNGLQTQFGTLNGFQPHTGINAGFTTVDIETWLAMKKYLHDFVSKGIIYVDPKEESQAINSYRDQSVAEFKSLGITDVKSGLVAGHYGKGLKKSFAEEWLASEIESVHNPATNTSTAKSNHVQVWYEKPVGLIGIGVFIAIIGTLAVYLIKNIAGIPL